MPNPRRYAPPTWPASRGTGGRFAAEQVAGFGWNRWPESAEYADESRSYQFELRVETGNALCRGGKLTGIVRPDGLYGALSVGTTGYTTVHSDTDLSLEVEGDLSTWMATDYPAGGNVRARVEESIGGSSTVCVDTGWQRKNAGSQNLVFGCDTSDITCGTVATYTVTPRITARSVINHALVRIVEK